MARTAVVAGTATAVSKGVSNSMNASAQQKAVAQQQRAAAEQQRFNEAVAQAVAQQQAAAPVVAAPATPAPVPAADRITLLTQLNELRAQGVISEEEFDAERARIMAS
jgi:glucan biosynthesis protein